MKLRVEVMRGSIVLLAGALLASCATAGVGAQKLAIAERSIPADANGPAADYPVVVGDAYTIGDTTYTPVDTMNYDEVGYATSDDAGTIGITAAHHTLPLPSYVEVTSLASGRTILARVERRGPMASHHLIALSPAAMAQLGAGENTPIRVRRVNPPEEERAELRAGREATARMDTPPGLLEVLKRKLPETGSTSLHDPRQAAVSGKVPTPDAIAKIDPDDGARSVAPPAAVAVAPKPAPAPAPKSSPVIESEAVADKTSAATTKPPAIAPEQPAPAARSAQSGNYAVQIGAFSVRANADRLAKKVDGFVEASGNLALVRVGPFATRGQAEQALAKLRSQGYSDARIATLK